MQTALNWTQRWYHAERSQPNWKSCCRGIIDMTIFGKLIASFFRFDGILPPHKVDQAMTENSDHFTQFVSKACPKSLVRWGNGFDLASLEVRDSPSIRWRGWGLTNRRSTTSRTSPLLLRLLLLPLLLRLPRLCVIKKSIQIPNTIAAFHYQTMSSLTQGTHDIR